MRRFAPPFASAVALLLVLAPSAFALNHPDHGAGLWGNVSDKVTTNAGFVLIGIFSVFVLLASLAQWQLDKRKHRRKAAKKARLTGSQWHGGW